MKNIDRRRFLKTFGCAACYCGFGSAFRLGAQVVRSPSIGDSDMAGAGSDNSIAMTPTDAMAERESETSAEKEAKRNEAFALQWITGILETLDTALLTDYQLREIVKKTSQAHHDLLNVPEMVKPYIGKPQEFIDFLQSAWGWVIKNNESERLLIVNENKPFCVCPLLKNAKSKFYPALCYCSEGFAEKMFSEVYQRPVKVVVAESVQRGDPSCIYHVRY